MTRLLVNGKQHEELGVKMLYTINESNKATYISDPNMKNVEMYNTDGAKIFYQRTLVFPLRKAGDFKSTVKDLKIWNYVK